MTDDMNEPHYGFTCSDEKMEVPNPSESAEHAWSLIANQITALWPVRTKIDEEIYQKLHQTLQSIRGASLKPWDTECDACNFLDALAILSKYSLLPNFNGTGIWDFTSVDLETIFAGQSKIPAKFLVADFLPQDRERARHSLLYAEDRVKWLKAVMVRKVIHNDELKVVTPRVVVSFKNRELIGLTLDDEARPLTGARSYGTTLLFELWNARDHKLTKEEYDHRHPDTRNRGKSQLKRLIGPTIFDMVYLDNGRKDKCISLSNLIEIKAL